MADMLRDSNIISAGGLTNFEVYSENIFVGDITAEDAVEDYSCREYDLVSQRKVAVRAMDTTVDLTSEIAQDYNDGIDLFKLWEAWHTQMLANAPPEMQASLHQTNIAWAFYYLNETLISETFNGIVLALLLSLLILTLATLNPIMSLYSVLTIVLIIVDVFAYTVVIGYSLGVLEAVNYIVVIGMSIDYCVHMSEAFTEAHHSERQARVVDMLEEMGVSVISGAISTLGCIFFMFFAPNTFFFKFACFVTATIVLSCVYSLIFFPALLACIGPEGHFGDLSQLCKKKAAAGQASETRVSPPAAADPHADA